MNIALVNIFPKDHLQILNEPSGATEMLILNLANHLQNLYNIDFYYTGESKRLENINYINIYSVSNITYNTVIINRFVNVLDYSFTRSCPNIVIWFHDLPPGPNNISSLSTYYNLTLVFVSEYLKCLYLDMFPDISVHKLKVIHNFVDLSLFDISADRDLCIDNKAFDILYMSAYGKSIFNDNYLRILKELSKTYSIVITHPNYEDPHAINQKNKELLSYGFYVLDPMNRKTLGGLIQDSKIVIAPHFKETFGCFAIESLYLGTPIIYHPDSGALEEIVDTLYSVDLYDIEAVKAKIEYLIRDRNIIHKKSFLIDSISKDWINII
jgi:glycosyltransferase involved in cell wall biosynthesis